MSCRSCAPLPKDVYGRMGIAKIRTFKIVENSKVRVIYTDASPIQLFIDGSEPPKNRSEASYFSLESGDRRLALVGKGSLETLFDTFTFKPNSIYTIILFHNHILQFEEKDITCPFPGYVRLQAYNMDRNRINVEMNSKMTFEALGDDMFMETIVKTGVYDMNWNESHEEWMAEIELRNSSIYTLFFLKDVIFLVENAYCVNLV